MIPLLPVHGHPPPDPLLHRYFEAREGRTAIKVAPGGVYVTKEDEDLITVLGSCVSACIHDPVARVGGMNHFMLPSGRAAAAGVHLLSDSHRYGCFAMESLINEILKLGGRKERLAVKLFGGAHVLPCGGRVGEFNIAFAREYVRKEGLKLLSEDMGGSAARRLKFRPQLGQAYLWRPGRDLLAQIARAEQAYLQSLQSKTFHGELELF